MRSPNPLRYAVKRALALAGAVGIAVGASLASAPQAAAYTPAKIAVGSEVLPQVNTTLEHSFADGVEPAPGANFTYTGTVDFANISEPATTYDATIQVTAGGAADFDGDPVAGDFTGGGDAKVTFLGREGDTYIFQVTNVTKDVKLTFKHAAIVKASAGPGSVISGSIKAQVNAKVKVDLGGAGWIGQKIVGDEPNEDSSGCEAVLLFQWQSPGSGTWLADLKFGDALGKGQVQVSPAQLKPASEADVLAYKPNTINITADNKDITGEILGEGVWNPDDPSRPSLPGNASSLPQAKWQTSLNFPFDPSTYTGKAWLPANSTVTVAEKVTFTDCISPGLSTDFTTQRLVAANLQIARANDAVDSLAVDTFMIPGKVKAVDMCEDLVYSDPNGLDLSNVGKASLVDGGTAAKTSEVGDLPKKTEAIAIPHNEKYHNRLYYLINKKLLYYYDAAETDASKRVVKVGELKVDGNQANNSFPFAAGFDKEDKLVFQSVGSTPYWYRVDAIAGSTDLTKLSNPSGLPNNFYARDIVFDSAGNAYVSGTTSTGSDTNGGIYKINSDFTAAQRIGSYGDEPINGLAFGKDGNLYGAGLSKLYRIDTETVESGNTRVNPKEVPWAKDAKVPYKIADLTSCNTEKPKPSVNGGFNVSKSAVDPVTGAILPAGKASANGVTLDAKGVGTASYVVTVTNVGEKSGKPAIITDAIVAPEGFEVRKVVVRNAATGEQQDLGNSTNLKLDAGEMDGNTAKSWIVSVTFAAKDPQNIDWSTVGVCESASGSEGGKGFFNKVTMDGDTDGEDNNEACVPAKPKTKVELRKRIIDNETGAEITDPAELDKFNLSAANKDGLPSGVTGKNGVVNYVLPGTYILGEAPGEGDSGFYEFGEWACTGGNLVGNELTVNDGEDVSCVVTNVRTPKVHLVKDAADPVEGNPHVGKEVYANAQGEVSVSYRVRVINDSPFAELSRVGAVSDFFSVPAGLEWDGDKVATVEFEADSNGQVEGLRETFTSADINAPVTLATGIRQFPQNGTASFLVTLPLKVAKNASAQQKADFGTCVNTTTKGTKTPVTSLRKGVPNRGLLVGEDFSYSSDAYLLDNIACVPVKLPTVHVEKTAADPIAQNAHVGKAVAAAKDGAFEAAYRITVTNTTPVAANAGAITDTFTVPAGLVWDGSKKATIVDEQGGSGETQGFIAELSQEQLAAGAMIASGINDIEPNGTHSFLVTIPLKLDNSESDQDNPDQPGVKLTKAQVHETALGTCEDNPEGLDPAVTTKNKGIANQVTLAGEDTTYSEKTWEKDNIACVPVELPSTWKVQKEAKTADGWAAEGAPIKADTTQTGYEVTTTYRIRVTNNGSKEATHPEIFDVPSLPTPWKIDSVKIAETEEGLANADEVQSGEDGRYKVPFANKVAGYRSMDYFIQVHATADNVLPEEWKKIGECNVENGGNAKLGAFNKVNMDGDTDGEDNNDACTPITPGDSPKVPGPGIEKTDINGTPVAGAVFALYDAEPVDGVQPLEVLQGTDGAEKWDADTKPASKFVMETKLERGKTYWVKEIKSPSSEYTLLPVPLKFIAKDTNVYVPMNGMQEAPGVCPDGAQQCTEEAKIRTIDGGTYTMTGSVLKVADPRAGELPKAGGIGHWTLAGGAAVLIMLSLTFLYRDTNRRWA